MTLKHGTTLDGLSRCPHCGVANPLLTRKWHTDCIVVPGDAYGRIWGTYECSKCKAYVLARGHMGNQSTLAVDAVYPSIKVSPADLPISAKKYLDQACESLSSPDGAVMLTGAAVDSMLKDKGLVEGSVYSRIDQAVEKQILTKDMADWAHRVRLDSNRPRHADKDDPHVSNEDAQRAVDFTITLGYVLFTLPKLIAEGKADKEPPC